MPFQRRRKCIFHWRGRAWLTIWDRVKIPRYSHKLKHRKRVTSELHDTYFRSMTIKHAIPKTAEVHIPMASYGEILSGRLDYYKFGEDRKSVCLETRRVWRENAVEKNCTRQKGPSGPPIEFGDQTSLETGCGRGSQHPAESWGRRASVEQPWRTGKKRWWP